MYTFYPIRMRVVCNVPPPLYNGSDNAQNYFFEVHCFLWRVYNTYLSVDTLWSFIPNSTVYIVCTQWIAGM